MLDDDRKGIDHLKQLADVVYAKLSKYELFNKAYSIFKWLIFFLERFFRHHSHQMLEIDFADHCIEAVK